MIFFLASIVVLSSIIIVLAGSLSVLRSPDKPENVWFFWLTTLLAFWVLVNFFDSNLLNPGITHWLIKVDFAVPVLIAWAFLHFSIALIRSLDHRLKLPIPKPAQYTTFLGVTTVINGVIIACIMAGLVASASVDDNSLVITNYSLFPVFIAVIMAYFGYALTLLGMAYRRLSVHNRGGIFLIWAGFSFAFVTNFASNLFFPNVLNSNILIKELNAVGYIGVLLLVCCLYVAMRQRRLFDIRLVVARSLVYMLLLVFVALLYAGAITLLGIVISGTNISTALSALIICLIFIAAISFQYVKIYFSNITKYLFYKDGYEAQQVLDELNQIITSNLNLNYLTSAAAELLVKTMKSSSCVLVINDEDHNTKFYSPTTTRNQLEALTIDIEKTLRPHQPLITDAVNNEALKTALNRLRIELVMPLHTHDTYLGFITFGTKHNGVIYSHADVRLLSIAADSLAISMQNALQFTEIQNFNITLQGKIDEATLKLHRANSKLKSLDEAKDDFINMAAHQLRTPLTSIKGYVSMVLEQDAGKINKVQHDMLGRAYFSSQRMVDLIADLLNVSRLKTGKFIIETKPVNLVEIIDQELTQLQEAAASHSLKLNFDKPSSFVPLLLDEGKTRQVIMNFVDNAIYYTPAGGHITIQLRETSTTVEFKVVDTGIGVPKSEQPHLFTKFYRAGNAQQARPDGTGLGLFMAKKVIVAQDGTIIFNSKEGQGSTFGFIFSKAKQSVPAVVK